MALSVSFRPKFTRRIPDPSFEHEHGMECVFMYVAAADVPRYLPNTPNARSPKINRQIHRDIEASLLSVGENVPGTFHLKHNGITLVAQSVRKSGENFIVEFGDEHGILDGGHSYEIILKCQGVEGADLSSQFVKFEIHTQVPNDWIPEMAGGRNTSVQVQPMSLANLSRKFDWMKAEFKGTSHADTIAWEEGDEGEYTARDVVAFLTCFNVDLYPNEVGNTTHPVVAYERPAAALDTYEDKLAVFEKARPILKDLLVLYEIIRRDGRTRYNDAAPKRRGGALAFVEKSRSKSKPWTFPIAGGESEYRVMKGAAMPMLAAFRWLVEHDPDTGSYRWRGGFDHVLALWEELAVELMEMTRETSDDTGRNANAIGKSRSHWSNLHARVAMRDLMARGQ